MNQMEDGDAVEFGAMSSVDGAKEGSLMEELAGDIPQDGNVADDTQKLVVDSESTRGVFSPSAPKAATDNAYSSPPDKIRTDPMPTKAKSRGFNPLAIQNGLIDDENEGGIAVVASAGANAFDETEDPTGRYVAEKEKVNTDGWYELTGFSVQYEPVKGAGTVSADIRNYFEDVESAMISVSNGKYMMPVNNAIRIGRISLGAPTINFEERAIYEYVDGKWRRV